MKKNTLNKLFFKSSALKLRNFKGYVNPKSSVLFGFVLVLIAFTLPEKMLSADIERPISSEIFVSTGPSNVSLAPSYILNSESGGGLAVFTKAFSPSTIDPGSITTLTFTIDNSFSGEAISDISFIDELPMGMTIATPANVVSSCGGTLTAVDGGSTISLTEGSLGLGEICTISVDVTSITAGIHTNTSGDLTYVGANTGSNVVEGAIADLTVNTALAGFSKSFFHDLMKPSSVTTLTFTIDNSLSGEDISGVNFIDNLPSGMTIATPANVVSSCGGTLTAPNGGNSISYSGGVIGLGQICTISVDVTSTTLGVNTNTTSDLTYTGAVSSPVISNPGSATADITVSEAVSGFSKVFSPNTIGPGSVTTLTFTIDNASSGEPISDISFIDNLPAGMTIATPANAVGSCGAGGILTAPDGGSTISYTGGALGLGQSCTISVNVTSSTPGISTNETGFLNYLGTNSGSAVAGNATADLTVVTTLPNFSKSFSPNTVNAGERSRLTFTIDNSSNASVIGNLDFTDHLPDGMVVASPANLVFDCISASAPNTTVTANPGSSTIIMDANGSTFFPGFEVLAAGATCTVSVDVIGISAVDLNNVTEDLLADFVASGKASAILEINPRGELFIDKTFVTNPATPGGTTDLVYTIRNFSRNFSATNISFTDNLDAALSGLAGIGTPISACGGTLSGTSTLSFTSGAIGPGGSCTFTVPLEIPAGAAAGAYSSTTSVITGDIDGNPVTGNTTTEELYINYVPTITKTFLDNPVAPGGTSTLEFTITNTDPVNTLTDIAFTDNMTDFLGLGFPVNFVTNLPVNGSCGASSTFTLTQSDFAPTTFTMSGGEIAPGGSCTFSVDIVIPDGFSGGTYTNTTSTLSGTVGGNSVLGLPASDDLDVLAVPRLNISFTDDPVNAGDNVDLEFTLSYDVLAPGNATDVGFTLDLAAVIPGLTATGPVSGCGGTLATSVGDTFLTFSGGTLMPGDVCTFNIPVQVPAGAVPGAYPTSTSVLAATVGGLAATGDMAMDDLIIGGLTFTKEFIDNPVLPGQLTTLRFTIDNATTLDATDVLFTDNLTMVLSGLVAEAPLPMPSCGGSLLGTSFLIYNGGTVTAGSSCTFDVMVRVPAGAASGTYINRTSNLQVTLNSSTLVLPPAINDLVVEDNFLMITKTFASGLVTPGDNVTVNYELTNLNLSNTIDNIAFTDDFGAALTGLSATGLPAMECGGGTVSGTSILDFSGGSLAAGASCTFSVTLSTSPGTPYGTSVSSTTSAVTGTIGGLPVIGDAATDILDFQYLVLSKSIAGPVAGGSTTITFTIENANLTNKAMNLSFTDDLNTLIPGLVVTDLPSDEPCGRLSAVSGTSTLLFTNGILDPGQSCSFEVTVFVPCGTPDATYTNTTSEITGQSETGASLISPSASGDLEVLGAVKTWNGVSWLPPGVPNPGSAVIINGNYQAGDANNGNLDGSCSLTINSGFTLSIPAGGFIRVNGDIIVDGSLLVEDKGSVVQVDDASLVTNNGTITVEKITPIMAAMSFMVSGSPMTGETREGVFGPGYIVRHHVTGNFVPNLDVEVVSPGINNWADDNGNNWLTHVGGLNPGEGYMVFPQLDGTDSGSYTQSHTLGTLTNGVVNFNMGFNGTQNGSPNILANPYASAIDVESFFDDPANIDIDVVYFWEHITPLSALYPGYSPANFNMGDISLYSETLAAGVAAANDPDEIAPTRFIASGQGFGVKPTAGGIAKFNNAMRVTGPNNTYRSNDAANRDRLWMHVYNDTYGLGSTALIGFTENTVDGYINSEDIHRLPTPVSLYSELETGEELVVNALGTFETSDAFYLSFTTQVKETQDYRISLQDMDGVNLENASVYLIDSLTGSVTNLTEGDYTFQSGEAVYHKRFKVVFEYSALGINGSNLESISLYPNPAQNVVTIVSPQTILTSAVVYDIRGRKVSEVDFKNQTAYQIDLSSMEAAIYFIQIATENGTVMKQVMKK